MSFTEGTFSYSGNTYPKITQSGTDDTASFLTAMEGISSVNVTTVGDQSHSTFKIVDFGGNALHIEGDLDIDFGRQIWIFKGTGHKDRLYVKNTGTLQLKSPQTENGFSFNPEVGDIIYAIEGSGMGWNSKALRIDNNSNGKSNFIGVNFRGEFSATITGSVRFENCIIDKIGNDGDIQFNISNTTEMVDCKMYASGTSGITFRAGNPTISNVQIYGARDSFNNESNVFQIIEKLDSDTGARADISQFGGWKTGVRNAINGTRFLWANHLNNSSTNYSAGSLEVTQTLKIKTVDDQYNPIAGAKFYLKDDASLANADLVTVTNLATPFSFGELSQGDYVTDSGTLYITRTNVLNWVQGKKYGGNNYVVYSGNYYKSTKSNNYSQPDVADWNLLGNTFTDAIELFRSPSHTLTNFDTNPATTQRTYEKTTDSNGEVAEFEVLIGEGYSPQGDVNGWVRSRGKNPKKYYYNQPYTDDIFDYGIINYDRNIFSTEIALRGADGSEIDVVLQPDLTLTESDKDTVDAYTEIDTPQKFYDRAKSYLVDNYAGEVSTIVSRSGNEINLGSFNLDIDANASSAFAISGTTITIKASSFAGNLTSTGLVTTLNNAVVLGEITDSSGTRATLQYNISGLIQHSRVQLYNVTADAEIFNGSVNATTYSAEYTEGVEVTIEDEIRLRVTRQNGVTAYLPFEATAIASASGFSFKVSQQLDLVYNSNGIDGSSVSTLTADFPNVQVDVDDADGSVDVREIYAHYVNIITTEEGIRQWFGGITALNAVNYQVNTAVNDLTIQNIGTNGVNLGVARIFRDDGAIILAQGTAPITQDNGEFVQFIAPQVESALTPIKSNTDQIPAIKKNTNLIPALL
jgi:hypothetical protein